LKIVGFQIEIGRIFSLVNILTNLKIGSLQSNNFEKLVFVNKNWPNDVELGCNIFFYLVKLIEFDVGSKEKLKGLEGSFEQDELKETYSIHILCNDSCLHHSNFFEVYFNVLLLYFKICNETFGFCVGKFTKSIWKRL
jgi:hypothetical protein